MKNIVSIFLLLAPEKKDKNNNNNNNNIAKKDSVDLELLLALFLACINFELTEAEKCFDKEGR